MKLHLVLLLALVINLSNGLMAELKGPLGHETCTGDEYSEFKNCVMQGVTADPNLTGSFGDIEEAAFVRGGGDDRKLFNCAVCWEMFNCAVCPSGAPRGTFCFYWCGGRRRLDEVMGTPNLRRVQESDTAVFQGGDYTGNAEGIVLILETMTTCLDEGSAAFPCLGTTDTMTLTVTL
jgi:hypothetical protein